MLVAELETVCDSVAEPDIVDELLLLCVDMDTGAVRIAICAQLPSDVPANTVL